MISRLARPMGRLALVLPLLGVGMSRATADPLYTVTDLGPMSDGLNGGDSHFGDINSQRRLSLADSGQVTTTTWGTPAPYAGSLPGELAQGPYAGQAVVTSRAGNNLAGWGFDKNLNWTGFVNIDGKTSAVLPQPGDTFTQALAVNEQGYATGITGHGSQVHPFFFVNGEGGSTGVTVPDNGNAAAYGMNNNVDGRLVGEFINPADSQRHAFLADGAYAHHVTADLNTLISPDSGWTLTIADSINGKDQIAAFGKNARGESHELLLTPTGAVTSDSIRQAVAGNDGSPVTPHTGDGSTPDTEIPEPGTQILFGTILVILPCRRLRAAPGDET